MNKKEIKNYLKRVDELETKLTGEDKETFVWLIYGYNQCAKLLNETEQQLHEASLTIQEMTEQDIECPSNCEKLEKLQQENEKLKDNWNKLKEWLKEYEEGTYGLGSYETGLSDGLGDVIKKMQELKGSDSNE